MVRKTFKGALLLAVVGVVAAACSNSPSTPAAGSGSSTTARLPPRLHHVGSTSTTAAAGTSTTVAGGAGTGGTGSGTSPTLGVSSAFGPSAVGFGQVRPAEISLGGDPTGVVTGVTWQSWGGGQATGSGTSTYVGPNQSVAQGTQEMATVVASDLGSCGGKPAYQQVKWYFPQQGETLSTGANSTINACTGP
jgi:hypothetical protein